MPRALSQVFKDLSARLPMSVMANLVLERALPPEKVESWFEENRGPQYTRSLLFSAVFELMILVALKARSSLHSAFRTHGAIEVSVTSVYNKVNTVDPNMSRAMVREAAIELGQVVKGLKGERPELLPGYRVKLLDGNCLEASEHRLKVLRNISAGPLAGKSLVVYDPWLAMPIDVFPCEDGHAQERALLDVVLPTVEPLDLWIWDRNFCCRKWLAGVRERQGRIIGRYHRGLPYTAIGHERFVGSTETGAVYEQKVEIELTPDHPPAKYRMIRVVLKKATRDGETEIRILTDLSKSAAPAKVVAELYRRRWEIELTFQKLEKHLNSEINALAQPKGALFAFCVALVAYCVLTVVMAALRRAHGHDVVEGQVSAYYIASDLAAGHAGVSAAVRPAEWRRLRRLSDREHVDTLLKIAASVNLAQYRKSPRGPKKPQPPRTKHRNKPHVSTARLLQGRE